MKKLFIVQILLGITLVVSAANTVTTVEQVTEPVTLTEDVDYHITSTEPFTTTGSIDIVNTDHAVIFLDEVKPQKAISYLAYIKINGVAARNNQNCQIRIYNQGALILPYGTAGALTVYSEPNFEGESANNFNFGNSGGYMQTLTDAQLKNRIKSFKLKRGYMVTFAIGDLGRGYSRCFIADTEDLEFAELPAILNGRIASYRLFRWQNTSKKGIADTRSATLYNTFNATWTYGWGMGNNLLPNAECVVHHIYENWPSASELGGAEYCCHLKTNNEPLNSADDHPNTIDEILANWPDLMRTGMRLLSPSSWDGSPNFMKQFLDSIDKRGWRCDVADMHCYWAEGSFNNLKSHFNNYRRPIWISEFVWGASWNNNGVFAYKNNVSEALKQNGIVMGRILDRLNSWDYIERYCYWNSEASYSRLTYNGSLSPLGEYFAEMNTGAGYVAKNEYIPNAPSVSSPTGLSVMYTASQSLCSITWTENTPELLDSVFVEVKKDDGEWETLAQIDILKNKSRNNWSYSYETTEAGNFAYRVRTVGYDGKDRYSDEGYNIMAVAESLADTGVNVGTISTLSTSDSYCFFPQQFTDEPVVVFGSVSNNNSRAGLVDRVRSSNQKNGIYTSMITNVLALPQEFSNTDFYRGPRYPEYTSFLISSQGTGNLGELPYEAALLDETAMPDTLTYTFTQAFKETPVVMATPVYISSLYPLMWRVFDVTPTGCRIAVERQAALEEDTSTKTIKAKLSLFAIEKGRTTLGDGTIVIVNDSTHSFTSSATLSDVVQYGEELTNPKVLVQLQTRNRNVGAFLRTKTVEPGNSSTTVRLQVDASASYENRTVSRTSPMDERIGWIVFGQSESSGIELTEYGQPKGANTLIAYPSLVKTTFGVRDDRATTATVYSSNGQALKSVKLTNGQATIDASSLPAGIYVVRTNANHSTKIVKK
ncbi:MAG: T9SS type A sorting domain-containing protein [Prevotella sp.]|nr:T9SS type A sorting domain-containing protein [Prevotella sp.]